ncbi:MAG: hypothetical protein QM784_36460 [Polyangiaceae bacterium]
MARPRTYTLGYDHRDFYRHIIVAVGTAILGVSGVIVVAQRPVGTVWAIALFLSAALSAASVWHLARTRVSVSSEGL